MVTIAGCLPDILVADRRFDVGVLMWVCFCVAVLISDLVRGLFVLVMVYYFGFSYCGCFPGVWRFEFDL